MCSIYLRTEDVFSYIWFYDQGVQDTDTMRYKVEEGCPAVIWELLSMKMKSSSCKVQQQGRVISTVPRMLVLLLCSSTLEHQCSCVKSGTLMSLTSIRHF